MADTNVDYNSIVELIREQAKKDNERRKKKDWVAIMPVVLSIVSGCIVVAVWMLLTYISPRPGADWRWLSFFGDYTPPMHIWPKREVNIAYVSLIVSMVMCVIAFICNKLRMKRAGDKYNAAVFFIGAVALVTFVVFLVRFLPTGILGF